jgi:hypothetical protein
MKNKKSVLKILSANSECFRVSAGIAPNVFGLGEVAEPKSLIEKQNLKIKIKCQLKTKTAILPNPC